MWHELSVVAGRSHVVAMLEFLSTLTYLNQASVAENGTVWRTLAFIYLGNTTKYIEPSYFYRLLRIIKIIVILTNLNNLLYNR